MDLNNVIIRPIITEKSIKDATFGKFTFQVGKEIDKNEIKKAIEGEFKVNVVDVATSIVKGKKRRFGTRRIEKLSSPWKKASVTLKKGQKIDLFDTGGKNE